MKDNINLWYDCSIIKWDFKGEKIQHNMSGIEYASVQGKYIYVESFKDGSMCYYYISIDNKKIICYDEVKKIVSINDNPVIIFEKKPYDIDVSNDATICVIVNENEMKLYDDSGKYKCSIISPDGYKYLRFFSLKDNISVICQGCSQNVDQYGRNDWKFVYKDKSWIKKGLAY